MDLTNIWQEHKTFILLVMAGLLVFFVGQTLISTIYPIDEMSRTLNGLKRDLRVTKAPTSSELSEARELNDVLLVRFEEIIQRINFKPNEKYLLSKSAEKPDIQYDRLYSEARDTLVEGAKTLNITVDPSLGMPDLSPTRNSEIQRALTAMDVVTRVTLLAIESQISSIESISMVPDQMRRRDSFVTEQRVRFKMRSSAFSLADFLRRFALLEEVFFTIDKASFKVADKDGLLVAADFEVSILKIKEEEAES